MSSDLILEIYTEEIPASYQAAALKQLDRELKRRLDEYLVEYDSLETYATPRRLAALIRNTAPEQKTETAELKGPPENICFDENGQPTRALEGFALKAGLEPSDVTFEKTGKGSYATATVSKGGSALEEFLFTLVEEQVQAMKFPKTMRWGSGELTYARPVLHIFVQYGERVLTAPETEFYRQAGGADSIVLHMILSEERVRLKQAADYLHELRAAGIEPGAAARRQIIVKLLKEEAARLELEPVLDDALLDEVNFLVEKPAVVAATFDKEYLELPDIVILSEMQEHQKYFGLCNKDGSLSHHFLIISNGDVTDEASARNIAAGNARVLRARLSDGAFFLNEDRKKPLIERVDALKKIVFQEGMGSMFDKKERLKKLYRRLAEKSCLEVADETADRACDLIKADLSTQLVYEFDHLQGEIGSIYAAHDGEEPEVAVAIKEHYMPRNRDDDFPSSALGTLLSLTDKIDNIISGFLLGKEPTSSHDPFALRRQALYCIDIIINSDLSFSLKDFFAEAVSEYPQQVIDDYRENNRADASELSEKLWEFFRGRLATIFDQQGFDKKMTRAAIATPESDILSLYRKLKALSELKSGEHSENFNLMMAAFTRMNNILSGYYEKNKNTGLPSEPDTALFSEEAEKGLHHFAAGLLEKTAGVKKGSAAPVENYRSIFETLAGGKAAVDSFFDNVMVMTDDFKLRDNRLALLNYLLSGLSEVLNLEELKK